MILRMVRFHLPGDFSIRVHDGHMVAVVVAAQDGMLGEGGTGKKQGGEAKR